LHRDWFPGTSDLTVQAYVSGQPAMACAAALSGRSLAVLTGFTEQLIGGTGPSSIVRLSEHAGMVSATTAMISAFGASGFISFDFVIDADGHEHLLECNPRPIQLFHLGPMVGVNLAESLKQALSGDVRDSPIVVKGEAATVALFPHEWYRMSDSPALAQAYHDVPWEDPRLLKAIVDSVVRARRVRFDEDHL
jgi:hypothetical protein